MYLYIHVRSNYIKSVLQCTSYSFDGFFSYIYSENNFKSKLLFYILYNFFIYAASFRFTRYSHFFGSPLGLKYLSTYTQTLIGIMSNQLKI